MQNTVPLVMKILAVVKVGERKYFKDVVIRV
jgi:hypothetical protein